MQWHTQGGNITTNLKFKIDFTLPELSAKKIVRCGFHVGESSKGWYDMILDQYIVTESVLNRKFY